MGADAKQPAKHVGDVAAEHAAVGVQLVDHDVAELLEQLEPLGVMRQDRRVEHVRVGHHDLPGRADRRPDRGRRVAVVGRGRDGQPGRRRQLAELADLVLAERLGREQQQGPRGRVVGDGLQDRQRVAQRLARRRRGHDHDVATGVDRLDRLRLVGIGPRDATRSEPRHDPWIEPVREVGVFRRPCRQQRVMDDPAGERRFGEQLGQDGSGLGGGVGAHRCLENERMFETARV